MRYAESADVEIVMVAGRWAKTDGRLVLSAERLARLSGELIELRPRIMQDGGFVYRPTPSGTLPDRYVV